MYFLLDNWLIFCFLSTNTLHLLCVLFIPLIAKFRMSYFILLRHHCDVCVVYTCAKIRNLIKFFKQLCWYIFLFFIYHTILLYLTFFWPIFVTFSSSFFSQVRPATLILATLLPQSNLLRLPISQIDAIIYGKWTKNYWLCWKECTKNKLKNEYVTART